MSKKDDLLEEVIEVDESLAVEEEVTEEEVTEEEVTEEEVTEEEVTEEEVTEEEITDEEITEEEITDEEITDEEITEEEITDEEITDEEITEEEVTEEEVTEEEVTEEEITEKEVTEKEVTEEEITEEMSEEVAGVVVVDEMVDGEIIDNKIEKPSKKSNKNLFIIGGIIAAVIILVVVIVLSVSGGGSTYKATQGKKIYQNESGTMEMSGEITYKVMDEEEKFSLEFKINAKNKIMQMTGKGSKSSFGMIIDIEGDKIYFASDEDLEDWTSSSLSIFGQDTSQLTKAFESIEKGGQDTEKATKEAIKFFDKMFKVKKSGDKTIIETGKTNFLALIEKSGQNIDELLKKPELSSQLSSLKSLGADPKDVFKALKIEELSITYEKEYFSALKMNMVLDMTLAKASFVLEFKAKTKDIEDIEIPETTESTYQQSFTLKNGSYKVGEKEIKPGTYQFSSYSEKEKIKVNGKEINVVDYTTARIDLKKGDEVEISGASIGVRVEPVDKSDEKAYLKNGTYEVGKDIKAGKYWLDMDVYESDTKVLVDGVEIKMEYGISDGEIDFKTGQKIVIQGLPEDFGVSFAKY